ncbi:hypothetical protein X985_1255 [Burkholderia pseudomallei MSHR4012]|nr:hypothetical protein X978_2238 [Burkholderia pseudomallei MSHR3965]KGV44928.1 hypothetical protein X985_1255 [Burkholderia pseudomallei MSHR4012]KGV49821.1 hypothetical protein X983_1171 [Burkholderia pseudomallei MSHR4003]KGW11960.1 hypothetical protein X980_1849 [Burkholderia pseudomallei MSHR4000]
MAHCDGQYERQTCDASGIGRRAGRFESNSRFANYFKALGDWRAYIRHAYVRVSAVRSGWEVRREPGGGEMMGMVKGYVYLSADYLA